MSHRANRSMPTRRRLRAGAAALVLVTTTAVLGACGDDTASDEASPRQSGSAVVDGGLEWGVKESFRAYVTGGAGQGRIVPTGGASVNAGVVRFPVAPGSRYDADGATSTVAFTGSVQFQGHKAPDSDDYLLDITLSNVRLRRTGATGVLVADVAARTFAGMDATKPTAVVTTPNAELVTVSGGTQRAAGTTVSWENAATALTKVGSTAWSNLYTTGTAFDPLSYTLTLDTPVGSAGQSPTSTPATTASSTSTAAAPSTTAAAATSGSLVWQFSTYSWTFPGLSQARAATAPATLDPATGWVFPATAVNYDRSSTATTAAFGGSITLGNNAMGGFRIAIANPTIDIAAAGAATVTADVSYCTGDAGSQPCPSGLTAPKRVVVVVTFTRPVVTERDGAVTFTATPDYPAQPAPNEARGQFPQSFLDVFAGAEPALAGFFMGTGSGLDAQKAPAPLTVTFTVPASR